MVLKKTKITMKPFKISKKKVISGVQVGGIEAQIGIKLFYVNNNQMRLHDTHTWKEKISFVDGFMDRIKKNIIKEIKEGAIPEHWNSWHLRLLIKERIRTYTLSTSEEEEFEMDKH